MDVNGLDVGTSVSALTVFVQGLLSFFSPCVLPLLPVYIGYLSGGTTTKDEEGTVVYNRRKVMINTLFFVLGISVAFFLLGLGFSALGLFFRQNQMVFARIGGVIVILFGLYQLGVFGTSAVLGSERRLPVSLEKLSMSPVTALLLGFLFSFSWTPCVGPVLSSVLLMASTAKSSGLGFLLIGVYTLGFVLPFLAAGLFTTTILGLFQKHRNVVRYTVKIGGVLLILMGLAMVTGKMNAVSSYLSGTETAAESTTEKSAEEATSGGNETTTAREVSEEEQTSSEESASEETTGKPVIAAPEFSLTDQYGNTHTVADYRGKVIFLNFWATWCPPCRAEMPDIQKLYEELAEEGRDNVVILSIACPGYGSEQDEDGIRSFLDENGYTYPVLMDPSGQTLEDYYISAYPTTFMIDASGNLYGYVTGGITGDIMRDIIRQTIEG
ncbi:MAG: redoxin domain-containing protein [Lachnospiraceae bacterium]|nr:redoxin domain-containing protein [Lachnospiraceae bacterium]